MSRKVLIIDDDEMDQKILKKFFEKQGVKEIHFAPDGYVGLMLALRHKPDLIILDLMLPVGGGIGLLKNIRDKADIQHCPIIVYSASMDPVLKNEVLAFGVKAFIQKSCEAGALEAAVRDIFRASEGEAPVEFEGS